MPATDGFGQTTYSWIPGSLSWHEASSWSPGGLPGAADTVLFDSGTSGTDTIAWGAATGDWVIDQMQVGKGSYRIDNTESAPFRLTIGSTANDALLVSGLNTEFSLDGMVVNVANGGVLVDSGATLNLGVGSGGRSTQLGVDNTIAVGGTMVVEDSQLSSSFGRLGAVAGSYATTTISGANANWDNSRGILVGYEADAELNIENGAVVQSLYANIGNLPTGEGLTNVSSNGQFFVDNQILVGSSSHGVLNINSGGVVSSSSGIVGNRGYGEANISGPGSSWELEHGLIVGNYEDGVLNITAGGRVNSRYGILGVIPSASYSTGTVLVDGTGSIWNNRESLVLGGTTTADGGPGFLTVANDGQVQVGDDLYTGSGTALTVSGAGGNGLLVVRNGSTLSSAGLGTIGFNSGASGQARVRGEGSRLDLEQGLVLGGTAAGDGGYGYLGISDSGKVHVGSDFLTDPTSGTALTISDMANGGQFWVRNGSEVNNGGAGFMGLSQGSSGTATVTGTGSEWNNGSGLQVGVEGNGNLTIRAGGVVTNSNGDVGTAQGSSGSVIVTGDSSRWENSTTLTVGSSGNGTLDITSGGSVFADSTQVAKDPGSMGSILISGVGSRLENSQSLTVGGDGVGSEGQGSVAIELGGYLKNQTAIVGDGGDAIGSILVTGNGSLWENSGSIVIGDSGNGTLDIESQGRVTNDSASIAKNLDSVGSVSVSGFGSSWENMGSISVGGRGQGQLTIESQGQVSSNSAVIGSSSGANGVGTVTGRGSEWNIEDSLTIGNFLAQGELHISNEGVVRSRSGVLGSWSSSTSGAVSVTGDNSSWQIDSDLVAGAAGSASILIASGGDISSRNGFLARDAGVSEVTVTGAGSRWDNQNDLAIGGGISSEGGNGTLTIENDGVVAVGGNTRIWSTGSVEMDGGRFEFGNTSLGEFDRISGSSGSLAGRIENTQFTDMASLNPLQKESLDITEVVFANSGVLYGSNANLGSSVENQQSGEIFTTANDFVRFKGALINQGEVNNLGGALRFEQGITNELGGFIAGRGQFVTEGTLVNQGTMAFSGDTDILGDFEILGRGQLVTSGGATTTFHDDVLHNGSEIRTALDSQTVFFGEMSGAGMFTGAGTVYFEGDLRPGNSPDILQFGGDVVLGSTAFSEFEIGGLVAGEFDQLKIDGDFHVDGLLDVLMLDGFQLGYNQEFLIAEVDGELFGQFDGLDEGDLVGQYNGIDLFISYTVANGNGVRLMSVPEPGSAFVLILGTTGILMIRRRKKGDRSKA